MSVPVLTFFNNKGGVGKTSLVYHVAWMMTELDRTVLVADLDPQANLTAAFLDEEELAPLLEASDGAGLDTIYRCIEPLTKVGDLNARPRLRLAGERLFLLPGDLALSRLEDPFSESWSKCLGDDNLYRQFRIVSAFWQVLQGGAGECDADVIVVDVGPSLGAINRSALIATDHLVVPLGADLFSLQGLRNLGPTLHRWRSEWQKRVSNWTEPEFELPAGSMAPLGYVVQQHSVRLSRPVAAYDKWVRRIPGEYRTSVLGDSEARETSDLDPDEDPHRIATLKHYRSLIPLGQDARKPIFKLTAADGAIGSHSVAARDAYTDFMALTREVLERMEAQSPTQGPGGGESDGR